MDTGNSCADGPDKLGSTTSPKVMEKKPKIKNDCPPKSAAEEDTSSEDEEDDQNAETVIKNGLGHLLHLYDFSIQHRPGKFLRDFTIFSDSASDSSDSSGSVSSESETVTEEAQSQKDKTLAGPEKVVEEEHEIKNETPLKPAAKGVTSSEEKEDIQSNSCADGPDKLGSTTAPKVMEKKSKIKNDCPLKSAAEEDTSSEDEEDDQNAETVIKNGLGHLLHLYDFSIQHRPGKFLRDFTIFSDSASDSSDSSGSVSSESETVTEEAQSQKDKTLAGPEKLGFRSSPEVISEEPEIKTDTLLSEENAKTLAGPVLVKHGAKRLAEGVDKNSKRAKKMDDLNEGEKD